MARPLQSAAAANLPFRFLRTVGRGLFGLLFHMEIDGLDRAPAGGSYVLACNHLSWIDPLILMSRFPSEPRIHYLAAAEFTTEGPWFVQKIVKWVGGIIPVDRQSHRGGRAVVVQSLQVLRGGGVLGIFPEGKCGFVEGEIQPLKEGAALFAARTGSPVLIVGMSGTLDLYWRKRIRIRVGPLLKLEPDEDQDAFLARVAQAMAETVPRLDPGQPKVKRMTWLSRLF